MYSSQKKDLEQKRADDAIHFHVLGTKNMKLKHYYKPQKALPKWMNDQEPINHNIYMLEKNKALQAIIKFSESSK